jgi:hypothetical protein
MESEFPGNAHPQTQKQAPKAAKKPEKKIEKVVTGEVKQRKKPFGRKVRDAFSIENNKTLAERLTGEFIVPQSKKLFYEIATQALRMKLWGDAGPGPMGARGVGGLLEQRFNYASVSSPHVIREDPRGGPHLGYQARNSFSFDEIIFQSRVEAQAVLSQMFEVLDNYGVTTVSDLYSMCGITPAITDENYGWTDLRGSDVAPIRDGYVLDLPRPVAID